SFEFVFLSSRRRHTRFSRDWSSDVCSSDLGDGVTRKVKDAQPGPVHKVALRLGLEGEQPTARQRLGPEDLVVPAQRRAELIGVQIGRASCRERGYSTARCEAGRAARHQMT